MPGTWLTADEIIGLVKDKIRIDGEDIAFGPNAGYAQLYSGPKLTVSKKIHGVTERNQERAYRQAKSNNAILLDNSPVGQMLGNIGGPGIDLYAYLKVNPLIPVSKRRSEADRIMKLVSRLFVSSLFGEVATSVCGAGKHRVFYKDEIPTITITIPQLIASLLKHTDITKINGIEISRIRTVAKSHGNDAAFRLICLGELREAHKRALTSGDVDAYRDYLERREFYMVERNQTWTRMKKGSRPAFMLSPKAREARRMAMLNEFIASHVSASAKAAAASSVPAPITGTRPRKTSGGPRVA